LIPIKPDTCTHAHYTGYQLLWLLCQPYSHGAHVAQTSVLRFVADLLYNLLFNLL